MRALAVYYYWLFTAIALCMISTTTFFLTLYSSSSFSSVNQDVVDDDHHHSSPNLFHFQNKNIINNNNETIETMEYDIGITTTTTTSTTSTSSSSSTSSCFPYNSQAWLNGPRLGNAIQWDDDDYNYDEPFTFMESSFRFLNEMHNDNNINNNTNIMSDMINALLGKTICSNQSSLFLHDNDNNINDESMIRLWTTRLVYLAIHVHQHEPALLEARHRQQLLHNHDDQSSSLFCLQEMKQRYNIGPLDYECPTNTTKFLIVSLSDMGLGTNIRYGVVVALKAAMALGRIALIVNNNVNIHNITTTMSIHNHHQQRQQQLFNKPWSLASCLNRHDYQCFFASPSPCTITYNELMNASTSSVLSTKEMRTVFRHGHLPKSIENNRIIYMSLKFRPQRHPTTLYKRLHDLIISSQQRWISSSSSSSSIIQKVANRLLAMTQQQQQQPNASSSSSQVNATTAAAAAAAVDADITGGLLLYAMRPNSHAMQQINEIVQDILPPSPTTQTRQTNEDDDWIVGLPIRASDKCNGESECMPFEHYIRAAEELLLPHLLMATNTSGDNLNNNTSSSSKGNGTLRMARTITIIVTTESPSVIQDQDEFMAKYDLQRDFAFPFRIVNNQHDVMQGTGFVRNALAGVVGAAAQATVPVLASHRRPVDNTATSPLVIDADSVMLSAVSSLKAQLMARIVIGNCCSNFHQMLRELIDQGCGGGDHNSISSSRTSSPWTSTFYCLQDHPNPDYRLCCSWDKSSRCVAKRKQQQQQ